MYGGVGRERGGGRAGARNVIAKNYRVIVDLAMS